ncbi:MAG TPA: decarboxylating 6-phosphogluconate dehydrogenase [Dehalococcoidia bacterium]|nr:decarboxylating 6-phosphogluconate dehydrogenase [Dehalococcoidia bacterium]
MDIGMVGLGRMGANMVQRLLGGGHRVVAYARTKATVDAIVEHGAEGATSLEDLVARLPSPKVVWLMVPAGAPTQANIDALTPLLSAGDIIVDGGNSNYHETMRRAEQLAAHGIHFIDSGTSGGVWGLTEGYCLMVGGPEQAVRHLEPAFATLAPPGGYAHVGPSGAGHFVKMIHNGIEYGMMAAYGEGFELLQNSRFDLDLHRISQIWQHGSVVRSWLLELAERAFEKDPRLESIRGYVEDSGEGRWTVLEAIDQDVPAPIITLSLMRRFASRQPESFSAKVQAALRAEFGGHAVVYSKQAEQS